MGKLIGGTFTYLKIHFKDIMRVALVTGFPLIILGSTLVALGAAEFMRDSMNGMDRIVRINQFYLFSTKAILGMICYLIGYVILSSSVITFMQLKHERNGGPVEMSELWSAFFSRGWMLTLQMILVVIILAIGFMLLVIPGIYLMVPLALATPVFMIEKRGIFSSIERCFELIKSRWWTAFGALFVIFLIMVIPAMIVNAINTVIFTLDSLSSSDMNMTRSTTMYAVGGSILAMLRFILNTLFLVLVTIMYYSLLEEKEHVSLQQKLETMGSGHTVNKVEEEY